MNAAIDFNRFKHVYCVDFEYQAPFGENPKPHCFVALDIKSGTIFRNFVDDLKSPPYETDNESLFVAYYASAEVSCHLALGWRLPENILDLFCEFRCHTNDGSERVPASLLHAMAYLNLDSIGSNEKEEMRSLAMRGGPFTDQEKQSLLDYCESDVRALEKMLPTMMPLIDFERALLRGRYMAAIAQVEQNGIPINSKQAELLNRHWSHIQSKLVEKVNSEFGVYDGTSFRQKKFSEYLKSKNIRWPRLPSHKMDLRDETFKTMSITYPEIGRLREVRLILSKMRLADLALGSDSRNRCLLSPFRSKTGRNQPSNAKFAFGLASWLRNLIQPEPGHAIAYIDWEQQEFGAAASLSGDKAMMLAYASGDPYLTFAKQAGAVPLDATKKSHSREREQFKLAALGVQYGMGAGALALQLGQPISQANHLLRLHRFTYPRFWEWLEGIVAAARYKGFIQTTYGWKMKVTAKTGIRTIANFPIQGNGAEMLRIAIILAIESGIKVCAPVHDALLIEAPEDKISEVVKSTQELMKQASRYVLKNFELRSDVKIIKHPDSYSDQRGEQIWTEVMHIVSEIEKERCA